MTIQQSASEPQVRGANAMATSSLGQDDVLLESAGAVGVLPADEGLASRTGRLRARPRWARWGRRIVPYLLPLLVLGLWELISASHWVNPALFPSPSEVATTLWSEAKRGELGNDASASLSRWALGFAIGGGMGVILGSFVGLFSTAELVLDTSFQMLRTAPLLGLMPLLVLWLGLGTLPMVVLISLSSFFPLYLNTTAGIRNVDSKLIEVGRVHGLSWFALLRRVIIPAALPQILTGVRYGLGVAWLALIIAELMGATSGLGYLVTQGESLNRVDVVVGGIVIFAVVGKLVDVIVKLAEQRLLSWHDGYAASGR